MGGLCVASGWLSQFFISFIYSASEWPLDSQWVAYDFVASFIASGWLVHSQWVAFAVFFISFIYSASGGLMVASGWLTQTSVASFIASGWLVRSQWGLSQILLVLSILPVGDFLIASGWLRLVLS